MSMTGPASQVAAEGLTKVAHAIRRSAALYIATMVMPEGTTDTALFARADSFSAWIGGRVGQVEAENPSNSRFLGVNPWDS